MYKILLLLLFIVNNIGHCEQTSTTITLKVMGHKDKQTIVSAEMIDKKNDIIISTIYTSKNNYNIAGILCKMFNKNNDSKCLVSQFGSATAIINHLVHDDRNFAIISSDTKYDLNDVKFVKSLYYNPLLLISINNKNKKIGVLSGQQNIINLLGWKDIKINQFDDYEALTTALKNNDVDMIALQDYYPNRHINKTIKDCKASIFQFNNNEIDGIVAKNSGYKKIVIPSNIYDKKEIITIGTTIDLIANKGINDKNIKIFTDNYSSLKIHPAMRYEVK